MSCKLFSKHQYILLYHGYSKVSTTINSSEFEQIITSNKKESFISTTVILRLMNFNITVNDSHNNTEILNVSYKYFVGTIFSKKIPSYFGLNIIEEESELLYKKCYIFSIDNNFINHCLHEKSNSMFNFKCLPNRKESKECEVFPSNVEEILESTNKIFFNNANNCSFIDNNDQNDQSTTCDELIINRQKRKISPILKERIINKRPSLVSDLLINKKESQQQNIYSNNNDEIKSTSESSPGVSFFKILNDNISKDLFMKYLTEQYCKENLVFYLSVNEYRNIEKKSKRVLMARHIIGKHLNEDSEEQINIDSKTKLEILTISSDKTYPKDLFDNAQSQIEDMLKFDLMPRFMKWLSEKNVKNSIVESDKENQPKRKISFYSIKNKILGSIHKSNLETLNNVSTKVIQQKDDDRFSLSTFRRSFIKSKAEKQSLGHIFKSNTLSRSLSTKEIKYLHKI
uniref:RGS domain-containing protein n=1 Tax=Parastrongyloides trichosuri TaxID=131310 RepID=A0A0N4ZNJ1_PARTI